MKKLPAARTLLSRLLFRRPGPTSAPPLTKGPATPRRPLYKQNTYELWLMFGVCLVTLTIYILTLTPGVVPGSAALETGRALGLLPSVPATHPIFLLMTRAIVAVPAFDTVLRLNLFSALCGSLAAALLFRLTKRVLFELIRETPSVRLVPIEEEKSAAGVGAGPEDADGMEHVYASFGGLVTALTFAFCSPFWIASTSLHAHSFNLLLVLLTADLLTCYHYTGKTSACVAAMFLFGLGLVESAAFAALAPFALVLILLASIRYDQISESFVLLMLASVLVGLTANLVLFLVLSAGGQAFSSQLLFQSVSNLAHAHVTAFTQGLPKTGWLFVLLQTTVPLLIALVSVRGFSVLQDETTRWKWGVTNIIISAVSIACLLNLPKTAWSLAREGSYLPIMPCLSIAIATGALFVYWCLLAFTEKYNACHDLGSPSFHLRLLGCGMCGLLGIVSLRTLPNNVSDADGRKAAFADRLADEMLIQAGSARCLMIDGTLDLNLIIRSHLTGRKLTFIPCPLEPDRAKPDTLDTFSPFRLALPGTEKPPKQSLATFVGDWLHTHPKEHDQVAVVGTPLVWQRAGLTPVPHGLIYGGTDDTSTLDGKALLAGNREFWRRAAPLLAADLTLRPELRLIHARVREHASRLANDLGVLLENMGDVQGADSAYEKALQLDKNNLCSGLNRGGLRLRNRIPGASKAFISHALALTSRPGFFETFDVKLSRYGMLSLQEADMLLPAVLQDCELGSKPPANMIRLLEHWIGASRAIPQSKSPPLARAASSADMAPDAMLSQALAMWLAGQNKKAESLLRLIVGNRPANLSAWALLAEVLMTRNQLKEVNEVVLPAMRAIRAKTANADGTLVEMTQGCLLMRTVPANPEAARSCFERALSITPNLPSACDQLMRVDRMLGNAAHLEKDALRILADNPGHADANALLGSLRLGQKRTAEAEKCLRQSILTQPTAHTLNDLAELFRQQNKLPEAEQQARLAIRLAPGFYQAWDTLGSILVDDGRLEEAYGPLRCALALSSNDPRLYLTLTRLHIRKGLLREASSILDQSQPLLCQTSTSVRDEHAKLRQQLVSQSASSIPAGTSGAPQ